MALDIFFSEDICNAIAALAQANERALIMALRFGADAEAARLCRLVYQGALDDMALAFGLSPSVVGAGQAQREQEALALETRGVVVE